MVKVRDIEGLSVWQLNELSGYYPMSMSCLYYGYEMLLELGFEDFDYDCKWYAISEEEEIVGFKTDMEAKEYFMRYKYEFAANVTYKDIEELQW